MAPKSKRSRTVTSTAVAAAAATAAEHGVIVDGKDALKALPSDEAAAPEEAVEDDSPITDVVESGAEAPFEPSSQAEAEDDDDGFEPPAAQSKTTKKTKPKTKTKTKTRTKKRGKPTASRGESNDVTVATITTKKKGKRGRGSRKDGDEAGEKGEEEEEGGEEAPAIREPAVNSDYVPIPWKGRIGYACLNTYLRTSFPPIFCSRTCRIETILKQGKWETDGLAFVRSLGLQNAADLSKLIRWNEKYGIRFLRISSEMFPFASHKKYGYNLDFAKDVLAAAGRLAMLHGHRLTAHPGQFTQLGTPREEVVEASVKDLEYHSQLLRGLGLRGQADRDAVMILHMGGMFGDKAATLDRFRKNYTTLLSQDVKNRLVLENDDVTWSVHDLLPICQELNIPLVLDYHHHNIIHDASMRAGTLDVMQLFPAIRETWTRKNITQKQHYSEPCKGAATGREMRKHSPRVVALPPCPDTMDLMIEAKDKEQAVFELQAKYGIALVGGEQLFRSVIPHRRADDNRPPPKLTKAQLKKMEGGEGIEGEPFVGEEVPEDEIGMGGPERRVYWPLGKEDWLSPIKRAVNRKPKAAEVTETSGTTSPTKKPAGKRTKEKGRGAKADGQEAQEMRTAKEMPEPKKAKAKAKAKGNKVPAPPTPISRRRSAAKKMSTPPPPPPPPPAVSSDSSGLSSPPPTQDWTDTEEATASQKAEVPVASVGRKRRRLLV